MKKIDLAGKRFGKLVVLHETEKIRGRTAFLCRCDCGNEKAVTSTDLQSGNTKSCGCGAKDRNRKISKSLQGKSSKKLIDLTGRKFGRWSVLGQGRKSESGQTWWLCRCDCGNEKEVNGATLRNGQSTSCGCLAREIWSERCKKLNKGKSSHKRIDLTGQRFGRLVVVRMLPKDGSQKIKWECLCDCGKTTYTDGAKLRSGKTKSCGCLGLENATKAKITHGKTNSPLYRVWNAMKNRCYHPTNQNWKYYGGKGIRVCDEWRMSFESFYEWAMHNGYQENLTIDRIDADKDYCPGNCRWISLRENIARKARHTDGIKDDIIKELHAGTPCSEISRKYGVSNETLTRWKRKEGIRIKTNYPEAFKQIVFCMRKEGISAKEILQMAGINEKTFYKWLKDAGI